jgi:hypothetical protein
MANFVDSDVSRLHCMDEKTAFGATGMIGRIAPYTTGNTGPDMAGAWGKRDRRHSSRSRSRNRCGSRWDFARNRIRSRGGGIDEFRRDNSGVIGRMGKRGGRQQTMLAFIN